VRCIAGLGGEQMNAPYQDEEGLWLRSRKDQRHITSRYLGRWRDCKAMNTLRRRWNGRSNVKIAFPGVHRPRESGAWIVFFPDSSTSQSFKCEKGAARAYRDWLALHGKQPKATLYQYRGEPLLADVAGPSWPEPETFRLLRRGTESR
jgi:hypothetical protein